MTYRNYQSFECRKHWESLSRDIFKTLRKFSATAGSFPPAGCSQKKRINPVVSRKQIISGPTIGLFSDVKKLRELAGSLPLFYRLVGIYFPSLKTLSLEEKILPLLLPINRNCPGHSTNTRSQPMTSERLPYCCVTSMTIYPHHWCQIKEYVYLTSMIHMTMR